MLGDLFSRAAERAGVTEAESFARARERYAYVCNVLGVRQAPPLRPVRRVSLLSRAVLGDWRPRRVLRMAVGDELPSDAVFFHEIAHAKAVSCMGYRGYHGAPFLALLQLTYEYYWDGAAPDMIEDTVRAEWPRRGNLDARAAEIVAARAAVIAVRERFARLKSPPSVDRLAMAVATHFPERAYIAGSALERFGFKDFVRTQRDGALSIAIWVALALFLFSMLMARCLPGTWSILVTSVGAMMVATVAGVIFALDSGRRIGRRWDMLMTRLRRSAEASG